MKQRFAEGTPIMFRKKDDPKAKWTQGTVCSTRLVAPDGAVWRPYNHAIEDAIMGYNVFNPDDRTTWTGNFGVPIDEFEYYIEAAGRNPRRSCWQGDVEITEVHELQLLAYDLGLDENDTDIGVRLDGSRLSCEENTNWADRATLVVSTHEGSRIAINVLRLMLMAIHTS